MTLTLPVVILLLFCVASKDFERKNLTVGLKFSNPIVFFLLLKDSALQAVLNVSDINTNRIKFFSAIKGEIQQPH
jgi:hypothetical protein